MACDTRLVLGHSEKNGHPDEERVVLIAHHTAVDGKPTIIVRLTEHRTFVDVKVRKNQIQVIQANESGIDECTHFNLLADGTWTFTSGMIFTMKDGWMKEGAIGVAGKVVWDSGNTLNEILNSRI